MKAINKKSVVITSLNFVGLAGLIFLGRQLNRDASQVVTAYQELDANAHHQEDLLALTKTLTETAESRRLIDAASLSSEDLIPFIEKLEGLARTAGVSLKLEEPKEVADKAIKLELSFQATGSFAGLYHFLSLLENLPYQLDWRTVVLAFDNGTTWSGDFDFAVTSYIDTHATP